MGEEGCCNEQPDPGAARIDPSSTRKDQVWRLAGFDYCLRDPELQLSTFFLNIYSTYVDIRMPSIRTWPEVRQVGSETKALNPGEPIVEIHCNAFIGIVAKWLRTTLFSLIHAQTF